MARKNDVKKVSPGAMPYDPDKHHRRSIWLKQYDYSEPGGYFITICTQDWKCLFGTVMEEQMRLNAAGEMVQQVWHALPERFPTVQLDAFVVMPNHIHGIIVLIDPTLIKPDTTDPNTNVGAPLVGAPNNDEIAGRAGTRPAPTNVHKTLLGDILGAFKSITTRRYIDGVNHLGWTPFAKRLWQRNYWERVIRNGKELDHVRRYIEENPARWYGDRLHAD